MSFVVALCRVLAVAVTVVPIIGEASLTVHEPYVLKGNVPTALANFGAPPLTTRNIRGPLVVADGTTGCTSVPRRRYAGKIVLAVRGGCSFASKAIVAQDAGALGIIIANAPDQTPPGETVGELFTMADDGQGMKVRIHAEMIGPADGSLLIRAMQEYNEEVVVSLGHIVGSPMYMV